ncbi:MAG: hypothetical protein H6850_02535 [Alphaproteobacteria bacterium]|nr:MAG: hypothetical protein H6850_02535 [Alphaproteobacteria bacterium]
MILHLICSDSDLDFDAAYATQAVSQQRARQILVDELHNSPERKVASVTKAFANANAKVPETVLHAVTQRKTTLETERTQLTQEFGKVAKADLALVQKDFQASEINHKGSLEDFIAGKEGVSVEDMRAALTFINEKVATKKAMQEQLKAFNAGGARAQDFALVAVDLQAHDFLGKDEAGKLAKLIAGQGVTLDDMQAGARLIEGIIVAKGSDSAARTQERSSSNEPTRGSGNNRELGVSTRTPNNTSSSRGNGPQGGGCCTSGPCVVQ